MTSKKEERGFWDRHRNRILGRAEGEQEELAERRVCWGTPCGPGGDKWGSRLSRQLRSTVTSRMNKCPSPGRPPRRSPGSD